MAYPVRFISSDEGGYTVVVSGIEGAISEGSTKKEAEQAAIDVIADMANFYLDEKRPIPPAPSPKDDEELVMIPMTVALKIVLRNEMLRQKINKSELARRMGMSSQLLGQTIDLTRTRTSIDTLSCAFEAIGKRLSVNVV